MTKSIGFRVEPTAVNYAVVTGTKQEPELLYYETINAPKSYDKEALRLLWYRDRLVTILSNDNLDFGVIRLPESVAKTKQDTLLKRARIEGLIFAVLKELGINCTAGALNTISSDINSQSAKKYLSQDDFRDLNWSNIKNKINEKRF